MPRLRDDQLPKLRHHKASGLAAVSLSGQDFYLGKFGTPGAVRKYNRLVAEWLAGGRRPLKTKGRGLLVAELCCRYSAWAGTHYRKEGRFTSEYEKVGLVCRELSDLYGDLPVTEFGPKKLKAIRATWVRRGVGRVTVNQHTTRVRHIFGWGVEEELIPARVWWRLKAVRWLPKGRGMAPDPPPIGPVDRGRFEAILAHVPPKVRDVLRLLDATGMRPGEAIGMRLCDVDRSTVPWRYTVQPRFNKNFHHGQARVVMIGPKGREILGPWLDQATEPDGPVFRSPSHRRGRVDAPYYGRRWLRVAIRKAAKQAGVPTFKPNQLRHGVGTRIRAIYGLDAAQVVLGHADASITQVYAEADISRAGKIAEEMG